MIVKKLIEKLKQYDEYSVVICKGSDGGWDNIESVEEDGSSVSINFGGGSPFTDE